MIYVNSQETVKETDLKMSAVYLTSEGKLLVYLGVDENNHYLFYPLLGVVFYDGYGKDKLEIMNFDAVHNAVSEMIEDIFNYSTKSFSSAYVMVYSRIPKLLKITVKTYVEEQSYNSFWFDSYLKQELPNFLKDNKITVYPNKK